MRLFNTFKNTIVLIILPSFFLLHNSYAQETNRFGIVIDEPPGKITKSWIGSNLRGMGNQWVQSFINDFFVDADGVVYTFADWDESGQNRSRYKNGEYIGRHSQPVIDREIRDQGNNLWHIKNKKFLGGDTITKNGVPVNFPDLDRPVGLAIANNGNLMVADIGPDQQVKFYDISSDEPVLVRTFGVKGGALAPGKPKGVIGDDLLRFYGLRACGMDAEGNIYVGGLHPAAGGGSWIIAFTPEGEPIWRLFGETFITVGAADPTTDGDIIYGNAVEYRMDYTKEPGMEQGWFPYAITADMFTYATEDKRFWMFDEVDGKGRHMLQASHRAHWDSHPKGIIAIRQIEGRKYIFGTGQNGPGLEAYMFVSESIAKDMPLDGLRKADGSKFGDDWGYWVDENNDIWIAHEWKPNGIDRFRFQGVDPEGYLIYNNDARDNWPVPADCGLTGTSRIMYSAKEDALYITGYSAQNPQKWDQWGAVGTEVWCYDNFTSGNPVKRAGYPIVLMHEANGTGTGAGGITSVNPDKSYSAKSIYLEGDYIFVSNITIGPRDGRLEVYMFDKHTGESIGTIIPEDQPNATRYGWIDIINGLTVYQRSNGEYIILVEEGARNKNMMYRWCPTGDCIEHDLEITLVQPANNTYIVSNSTITMEATVTTDSLTVSHVSFFINNEKIAEVSEAPYTFTTEELPLGKYDIRSVATTTQGISKPSLISFVEIGDGLPRIKLKSPQSNRFYSVADSVLFDVIVFDPNGTVDNVTYYLNETVFHVSNNEPFNYMWHKPTPGEYVIHAIVADNDGNKVSSDTLMFEVFEFREPDNPGNVLPGLLYEYFKTSYENIPHYNQFPSFAARGIVSDFNISNRLSEVHFSFHFYGYIDIPEDGSYTFYTRSDDGSMLYIGDKLVVDNNGAHGAQTREGTILLRKGLHEIHVTYSQLGGGHQLTVSWSGNSFSTQIIPQNVLFRKQVEITTPPVVSIRFPSEGLRMPLGAGFTSGINLNDPEKVVYKVEYYANDVFFGQSSQSPFNLSWTPSQGGNYTIHAVAHDLANNTYKTGSRNMSVNILPEISFDINNEQIFDINDTIRINVTAIDDIEVTKIELMVNTVAAHSVTSNSLTYTINPPHEKGNISLKALATDNDGQTGEKIIMIKIQDLRISVPALKNASFQIYPNPARDYIILDELPAGDHFIVTIYSLDGRIILNKIIHSNDTKSYNLPISMLEEGMYFISIKNKHLQLTKLFTKIN